MAERGVDVVVGVRGLAAALVEGAAQSGAEALLCRDAGGGWRVAEGESAAGDAVLLKASRGVRLERALASLAD